MGLKLRKRTKRKVYKLVNPIVYAIEGVSLISKELLDKLRLMELASLDAFTRGQANREDWNNLTDMLNIAETMSKAGIGPEALDSIMAGQKELLKCAERYKIVGKFGLTGIGIRTLRDCHEYHDLQRQSVSRAEYERFIVQIQHKIRIRHKDITYVEPLDRTTTQTSG